MAGIDFGSFMNTFVGLQQRAAESERVDADRAFEMEKAKINLQFQAQEDTRQERQMKLLETQSQRSGEAFQLEQARRTMENQILASHRPFAEMQDQLNGADALAIAQSKMEGFRAAGREDSAKIYQDAIERAKQYQNQPQPAPGGGGTPSGTPVRPESMPSKTAAVPAPEPQTVSTTGAPASPQAAPAMNPARQSQDFYTRVREGKEGDRFTSAEGTEYKIVTSPEQVQADQANREKWAQAFGKEVPYPENAQPVSKKEMEIEEGKFKAAASAQRQQEIVQKEQEENLQVYENQGKLNQVLADTKATSRIVSNGQQTEIQGFSMDNLARERAGLQKLAESGQLSKPVLEAYNRAFGAAFEERFTKDPRMQASVTRAGPNEFRMKLDAPADTQVQLQDAMQMSAALQASGQAPSMTLRRSTPKELVQDFEAGMPQGSQMRAMSGYEKTLREAVGGPFHPRLPKPLDPASVEQVNDRMTKLTAAISRSIWDAPPDQRDAAKAEALNQLQGMKENYFIGQGMTPGRQHEKALLQDLTGGEGPVQMNELGNRLNQLEKILTPQAPLKGSPSGGPPRVAPGSVGQIAGAALMSGVIGAGGKTPAGVLGSIGPSTKDKDAVGRQAVSDLRGMSKTDKATAAEQWQKKRQTWVNLKVSDDVIAEMDQVLGTKSESKGSVPGGTPQHDADTEALLKEIRGTAAGKKLSDKELLQLVENLRHVGG